MIKRVNFTGRRRIPRDRVDIEVFDGRPRTFTATVDFTGLSLPSTAAVVLEATCAGSSTVQRFSFGEVGAVKPPEDRKLNEMESENVFFTLKVIDRNERVGRILGMAEHIRPQRAGKQTAAGRQGILPIDVREMGQELWQLSLEGHDAILFLNKDVPSLRDFVRSNPLFYAVVYPEIIRRLLTQAILNGGSVDEEEDRWENIWLKFGLQLHPNKELPPGREELESDGYEHEWIDETVNAFCYAHQLKDKFAAAVAVNEGDEP